MSAFFNAYKAYVYAAIVIALVAFFAYSNYWSYNHGIEFQIGEAAKEQVKAVDKAIADYKIQADLDTKAAVAAETARQNKRVIAAQSRNSLNAYLKKNPRVGCDYNPVEYGMLINSIRQANGNAAKAETDSGASGVPPNTRPK